MAIQGLWIYPCGARKLGNIITASSLTLLATTGYAKLSSGEEHYNDFFLYCPEIFGFRSFGERMDLGG